MMYKTIIKRLLDIAFGLIGFPFFLIAYIFLGPIIKITDRGPILYISDRIGKNGVLFKIYKFRSMYVNAPDIRNPDGSTYNSENDARVTRIGKILRSTSIDELPQVLNILNGTMSLIGPRPDPPDDIYRYTKEQKKKLKVRPGLTGYNQAYFRNSVEQNEKFNHDLYYANNVSFLLDVKIFFRTIYMIVSRKNVYNDYYNPTSKNNKA